MDDEGTPTENTVLIENGMPTAWTNWRSMSTPSIMAGNDSAISSGPKFGSVVTPTIISCAFSRISCSSTPSMRGFGSRPCARSIMASNAASASSKVRMPATTPPTSVLWRMSGDVIFMTSG